MHGQRPAPVDDPVAGGTYPRQATVVGGTPVTATVSLTSSAPGGGVVVALSSNNPTAATVPPSVTVPAGSTAATFTVTTNPVANPQSSIIIGTAGGATRSATLTVRTEFQAQPAKRLGITDEASPFALLSTHLI